MPCHGLPLLPVPRFAPGMVLGAELASSLLFTSAKVRPAVLEAEGFVFAGPQLEGALRQLLLPSPARQRLQPGQLVLQSGPVETSGCSASFSGRPRNRAHRRGHAEPQADRHHHRRDIAERSYPYVVRLHAGEQHEHPSTNEERWPCGHDLEEVSHRPGSRKGSPEEGVTGV